MNPSLFRSILGLVIALAVSSCAHPREKRIASNPQIYQALSPSDQVLVQQGRIREGLSKEGVFIALGRPDQVAEGKQRGARIEKWTYMGTQPIYTNSIGMGWGGGWGSGYWGRGYGRGCGGYYGGAWDPFWGGAGPYVTYVPYKAATVTFKGNKVTEYLTGPQ
jgi:hypothetical protein